MGQGSRGAEEVAFELVSGCVSDWEHLEKEYLIPRKCILVSVGASVNRCDSLAERLAT